MPLARRKTVGPNRSNAASTTSFRILSDHLRIAWGPGSGVDTTPPGPDWGRLQCSLEGRRDFTEAAGLSARVPRVPCPDTAGPSRPGLRSLHQLDAERRSSR